MSDMPESPPAFPVQWPNASPDIGMSLLDYFAGQALAGLCANPGGPFQANEVTGWGFTNCDAETVASVSYSLAVAMSKARIALETKTANVNQWRPIKDFDRSLDYGEFDIWLNIPSSPRSFWISDSFRVPNAVWKNGKWNSSDAGGIRELHQDYVTHWMPVPAPPIPE